MCYRDFRDQVTSHSSTNINNNAEAFTVRSYDKGFLIRVGANSVIAKIENFRHEAEENL